MLYPRCNVQISALDTLHLLNQGALLDSRQAKRPVKVRLSKPSQGWPWGLGVGAWGLGDRVGGAVGGRGLWGGRGLSGGWRLGAGGRLGAVGRVRAGERLKVAGVAWGGGWGLAGGGWGLGGLGYSTYLGTPRSWHDTRLTRHGFSPLTEGADLHYLHHCSTPVHYRFKPTWVCTALVQSRCNFSLTPSAPLAPPAVRDLRTGHPMPMLLRGFNAHQACAC